jgi:hypothetical protein
MQGLVLIILSYSSEINGMLHPQCVPFVDMALELIDLDAGKSITWAIERRWR